MRVSETLMNWQIIAIIAALIGLAILLKLFTGRGGKLSRHPYQKHTMLFSPDDRVFFRALRDAVGEEYEIFGKIRVGDIIIPKNDGARNAWASIDGRHFDFVLCDKTALAVVCAIQLQDKTHPARQAGENDPLPPICENLGLPLVRFHVRADYETGEIRERLRKAMVKEPFYLMETDGRREPRISNIEDMKF